MKHLAIAVPTQAPARKASARNTSAKRAVIAVSLVCGLVAGLLLAGTQRASAATATPTRASTMSPLEKVLSTAMTTLLNVERGLHGLKGLTVSSKLINSAHAHDLDMAKHNVMSHQLPGEAVFSTRITRAGYKWSRAGENIGWTTEISTAGLLDLQTSMYNEKAPDNGHRLNILNKYYKNVGIDVYIDTKHGKVWFTEDFGTPS